MKIKYIWVVTACAVFGGSHAASYSEVQGTTLTPDSTSLGQAPSVLDAVTNDTDQFGSMLMMDIEVLNTVPKDLPWQTVSDIALLTATKSDTFIAAIQPQATEMAPVAENRIFAMAADLSPSVPEPETWAMLLAGLGLIGLQLRRGHGGKIDIH